MQDLGIKKSLLLYEKVDSKIELVEDEKRKFILKSFDKEKIM